MVPEFHKLYLIGGMKVGGKDGGKACTTVFALDTKAKTWDSIEHENPSSRVKKDPDSILGPRFAHSTTYVSRIPPNSRARQTARVKSTPFLYVYGGYTAELDLQPVAQMHVFDVKRSKWAVHRPPSGPSPPPRAYHAAVLSPSGKYIVIHGGNVSDFYDTFAMSDELHLFDIFTYQWSQPKLHQNSEPAPFARRRHAFVEGVGRHEGSLVLYGGYLMNDRHSNDMFLCNILEPEDGRGEVQVIWERIDLLTSVPRNVLDNVQNVSDKKLSEQTAISGGCLVALPQLGKYVMIGGRSECGVRNSPLMLDPGESDEIAISQSMTRKVAPITPPRSRRTKSRHPIPRKSSSPCSSQSKPEKKETIQNAQLRIPEKDEAAFDDGLTAAGKTADRSPSKSTPAEVSQAHKTISVVCNSSAGSIGSNDFRKRKPRGQATVPCVKSRNPSSSLRARVDLIEVAAEAKEADEGDEVIENARVLLKRSREAGKKKSDINKQPSFSGPKKRRLDAEENGKGAEDLDFIPTVTISKDVACNANNNVKEVPDDVIDLSLACQSEFVSVSELKRMGRNRAAAPTRSRGRGRGRGRGRLISSHRTKADVESARKLLAEKEELLKGSAREIEDTKKENLELQSKNKALRDDNIDLNDQVKKLIREVLALQNQQALQRSAGQNSRGFSNSSHDGKLAPSNRVLRPNSPSEGSPSSEKDVYKKEISNLREQAVQNQTENKALANENYSLVASAKELESEMRSLEREINRTKNVSEKSKAECVQLRRMNETNLEQLEEATEAKERIENRIKQVEERELLLKSERVSRDLQLREEIEKLDEESNKRIDREQDVLDLKRKLAAQGKKHKDLESRVDGLKEELQVKKEKICELQEALNEAAGKRSQLEAKHEEVVVERDRALLELEHSVREHGEALKSREKDKGSLGQLRKELCDESIEQKRLKRRLESSQRVCSLLKSRVNELQSSLTLCMPSLSKLTKTFEEVMKESDEFEAKMTLASQHCALEADRSKNVEVRNSIATPNSAIGKENEQGHNKEVEKKCVQKRDYTNGDRSKRRDGERVKSGAEDEIEEIIGDSDEVESDEP